MVEEESTLTLKVVAIPNESPLTMGQEFKLKSSEVTDTPFTFGKKNCNVNVSEGDVTVNNDVQCQICWDDGLGRFKLKCCSDVPPYTRIKLISGKKYKLHYGLTILFGYDYGISVADLSENDTDESVINFENLYMNTIGEAKGEKPAPFLQLLKLSVGKADPVTFESFNKAKPIVIGRLKKSTIHFESQVSRKHCQIEYSDEEGWYIVEPAETTNGTFLSLHFGHLTDNDEKHGEIQLAKETIGIRFYVGDTGFEINNIDPFPDD